MANASWKSVGAVLGLWLAGLAAAAQFAKIAVPFRAIRALYPEAGSEVGWLLSLISLFGVVFGTAAGVVVATFGHRRLLLASLLLGAAVSFWQASLPDLPAMIMSRLLEGASHLVIVVAAPTLIAQLSSDRYRNTAMALWSTFFGVSFAVTAWLGLPFSATYGLSGLFLAHGGFMLAVAILLSFSLAPSHPRNAIPIAPVSLGMLWRQHLSAYRSASIAAPAVGWLFYTLTFVALLAILPAHLADGSHSRVVAFMPLAGIVVSLLAVPPLLLVLSATSTVIFGFVTAGAVLSLFWAGLPLAMVGLALFAVLGLVQGGSFAAVPELNVTVEARALANGAMAQMGNLGNSLGTPLLLMIQLQGGISALLASIVALYVTGCLAHLLLAHRRSRLAPARAADTVR